MGIWSNLFGRKKAVPVASSDVSEEEDRGKNYSQRTQNYLNAVTAYADLKDKARGVPMSGFMRSSLFITMQKLIPSEIHLLCEKIQAEMKKENTDMKAFISGLENSSFLDIDIK